MTFTSSVLGEVQHPINILQEYMGAFKNKCQAAIVSWLDGWAYTKRSQGQDEWVWLTLSSLAKELGYCRDTIHVHLKKLLEAGVIERRLAKRWPTDRAWAYRLVEHQIIEKILPVENQTMDSQEPDNGQSENQTTHSPVSDCILNTSPNTSPKPYLKRPKNFQEEEVIENNNGIGVGTDTDNCSKEISEERKQEISQYIGEFSRKDQSSEQDFLSEKIPQNLQSKLDKAGIEVDEKVAEAIASHHLSQSLGAAQHCIDTGDSIRNPKSVFLFQISRQPIEPIGPRQPVRNAADFQVEESAAPEDFWEQGKEMLKKVTEKQRTKRWSSD
ncbi:MAG: winged helix-turn-helix transcriptional regulator [Symploca sp. SIO1A3]|nr:winged helix-turn-helix transcriptional regulator [Symploca sp. SIO2C1]NER45872.1 winged helix-turn-helix transcriptional regulator [Symploca sp. SIO1A3]